MKTKLLLTTIAGALSAASLATTESPAAVQPSTSDLQPDHGWNWAMGEGVTFDETPIVSAEVSLAFDSKYLSYGFIDNNEPILTPSGALTFFDWVTLGSSAIFDLTPYGRRAGYKDREWKTIEYHPTANLGHTFGPDDFAWLPTTVEFSFGYDYEYHPRVCTEGAPRGGDTQYVTFELSLPDLWLEPAFLYERDLMRDNGTYLQLELGHTLELIEETLTFKPSIAQGWGNAQRLRDYACRADDEPLDYAALMDTVVKGEFEWTITDGVALSAYVAYSDFLFDAGVREAAARYEATGDCGRSWNFLAGAALTVSF